jgi:hypothetical protein
MHLLNLKNTSLFSQGRSRLADILRSAANGWVDKCIENHPASVAEFIRDVQRMEGAAATSSPATTINAAVHTTPIMSLDRNDP